MDFGSFGAGFGSFGTAGGATLPEFIGVAGAGDAPATTGGGSNDAVGEKTNGVYEINYTSHGVSGYSEDYHWNNIDASFLTVRILKSTADNTWAIVHGTSVKYTNPATTSVPPATGWVVSGSTPTPVPTLLFNTLITEQSPISLTNCSIDSRDYAAGSVTFESTSSATKTIEFGDGTGISDGDLYAVGYLAQSDGNATGAANVRYGVNDFVRASSRFGAGDTAVRGESWSQEFGKDRQGNDEAINTSRGFQFNAYSGFGVGSQVTISKLRVMA